MEKDLEKIGTLGVVVLCDVSAMGSGLYMRLDKKLWETYGILAGDRIEVRLQAHYRRKHTQGESEA